MRLSLVFSILAVFLASIALFFVFSKPVNKIAFIRSIDVLNQYKGMEDAKVAYQVKTQAWKSKLDTLQVEFQQALVTYEKEQTKYSVKEKELSEKLINSKRQQWVDYQKQIDSKAAEEDQNMTGEVLSQINDFLIQYSKSKGYTVVFGANQTGNIVYGDDAIDITTEVIEELNKTYSSK